MSTVEVIDDPARAQSLLNPVRLELLELLETPASAASLARHLDLPRQRVNYHLKELEAHRLIELVEEKRRGNVVERIYRRSVAAYAISTAALGALGTTPEVIRDRFSSEYQIALASRAVKDLGAMQVGAQKAGQKLPTFALEVEVRFATPQARSEFADELASAVAELVQRYHDESAKGGRAFRFYVGAYPKPKK
ncbi:MAG: helix-turn-helix domain-containing protein [Planctomycetota bacterium]